MAKIELSRIGRHVFTDTLSLYKFEEGWKIVGFEFKQTPCPAGKSPGSVTGRRPGVPNSPAMIRAAISWV